MSVEEIQSRFIPPLLKPRLLIHPENVKLNDLIILWFLPPLF